MSLPYLKIALLVCMSFMASVLLGQCNNLDFESGDFNNWSGKYGCNTTREVSYELYQGFGCEHYGNSFDLQGDNTAGQHELIHKSEFNGVDPYVNALPLQSPIGGDYIARIGDLYQNDFSASMTNSFQVTQNSSLLTLYYAIVLEAPGHSPAEDNPYFRIKLIDPNGNSVKCIEYTQDGDKNADGFQQYKCNNFGFCQSDRGPEGRLTEIVYRDWTAISINLQDYVGQTVSLEVSSGSCALGGHLGYSYFDATCAKPELLKSTDIVCVGNPGILTAPDGMAKYEWRKGSATGPLVSTDRIASVTEGGEYFCTMTPFSTTESSCPFTLSISVNDSKSIPKSDFTVTQEPFCEGEEITFTSKTTVNEGGINALTWLTESGIFGTNDNKKYVFTESGVYQVGLIAESTEGCVDTSYKEIEIHESYQPEITPAGPLCNDDEIIELNAMPEGGTWLNGSTVNPSNYENDTILTFTYEIGVCKNQAIEQIEIIRRKSSKFTPPEPFCSNDLPLVLQAEEKGGVWIGDISTNGKFDPRNLNPGWHPITYRHTGLCFSEYTDSVLIIESKSATLESINPVCVLANPIQIKSEDEGGTWTGAVNASGLFDPSIGAGIHEVVYSFNNQCPDTDTIEIEVLAKHNSDFDLPQQICIDSGQINITKFENGGVWSGSGIVSTQQGIFESETAGVGTHNIQYAFGGQCGDTTIKSIEVIHRPDPEFTLDDLFCLQGDGEFAQVKEEGGAWSGGVESNHFFNPKNVGLGKFTVNYSFGGFCPASFSKEIEVVNNPDPYFSLPDTLCSKDEIIQIIPNQSGGNWSDNAKNESFNPNKNQGYHVVTYNFDGNCPESYTDSLFIKTNVIAKINGPRTVCKNAGITKYLATPVNEGQFSGEIVNSNGEINPEEINPGTYNIIYTVNGRCGDADTISVTILDNPNPVFTIPDSICVGDKIQANFDTPNGTWGGIGVNQSGEFNSLGLSAGNYKISYEFGGSCVAYHEEFVQVVSYENSNFDGPTSKCIKEDPVQYIAENQNGTWSGIADENGWVNPADHDFDNDYPIIYTVDGFCPSTDTLMLTIRDFYRTNFDAPDVICSGDEAFQLEATDKGGGWYGDGITSVTKGTFDPAEMQGDTSIILYKFGGVCGSEHRDTIIKKESIITNLTGDHYFCWYDNTSEFKGLPEGGSFIFNDDTTNQFSANPQTLAPGTYTLSYGFEGECPYYDKKSFTIREPFEINDFNIKPISCPGNCDGEIEVNVNDPSSGFLSNSWVYEGDTIEQKRLTNACAGNYQVIVTDNGGCEINDSISIVNPDSVKAFFSTISTSCGSANGSIILDSTFNASSPYFFRINGVTYTDTASNLDTGIYEISFFDGKACEYTTSITINANEQGNIHYSINNPICHNQSTGSIIVDSISGGFSPYKYYLDGAEGSNVFNNLASGLYQLSIVDANNCESILNIELLNPPAFNISSSWTDTTICFNESVELNINTLNNPINRVFNAQNQELDSILELNTIGNYLYFASDTNNCYSDTVYITLNHFDRLDYNLRYNATEFCEADTLIAEVNILSGTGSESISWSNNSNDTKVFWPVQVNQSQIEVTVSNQCESIDKSFNITVNPLPEITFDISDTVGCEPLMVSINTTAKENYNFQLNNEPISNKTLLNDGHYDLSVAVSDNIGCKSDSLLSNAIIVHPIPLVKIGKSLEPTTINNTVQFYDLSIPQLQIQQWSIYNKSRDTLLHEFVQDPYVEFPKSEATYIVKLSGESNAACAGESKIEIHIKDDYRLYVPNSFTPNNDNHNDVFGISSFNLNFIQFELLIHNRWGELVYRTTNPNNTWNGRLNNQGELLENGVYIWTIKIKQDNTNTFTKTGHVNLVR